MPLIDETIEQASTQEVIRLKIANALSKMLRETPIDRIRVQALCDDAGVSRQTFYRHFGTKYEVVQWYWLFCAQRYLVRVGRDLNWHDSLLLNYRAVAPHIDFFMSLTKQPDRLDHESCAEFGYRTRVATLEETVAMHHEKLTESLQFQIRFFADAESRVFMREAISPDDFDPEALALKVEACVPQELHDLLDVPLD